MASTEQIAKSLAELEHCPSDSMRQMLLKGLPHAFGANPHAYQLEYAKLLRKCLEEERTHQLQVQENSASETGNIKAQLETDQAEQSTAVECVNAARAVVEEKASTLSQKREAAKAEEVRHLETKSAKDAAAEHMQKQEELKAEADSVANGSLQMLINGGWEDKESCQDFVSGVYEYLLGMNCETPLLAALPKALGSRPDERGKFDKMVLEEVVRLIDAKVAEMANLVEQKKKKVEDANATNLGAWAIWDIARDHEKAANHAHDQAKEELKSKVAEQKAMDKKVAGTNSSLQKALSAQGVVDSKVQEIELSLEQLEKLERFEDQENVEVAEPSPKKRKIDELDAGVEVQPVLIAAQGA